MRRDVSHRPIRLTLAVLLIAAGAAGCGESSSPAAVSQGPGDAEEIWTACSDKYPDTDFYADFVVERAGDVALMRTVHGEPRWRAGQSAPITLQIRDSSSGESETWSAGGVDYTFVVPAEWADTTAHVYRVWVGEPRYGVASFDAAYQRSSTDEVTCEVG